VRHRPPVHWRRPQQRLQSARYAVSARVDASVFPRIPGFFVVSAVYMIGEKAADVMLAEARRTS